MIELNTYSSALEWNECMWKYIRVQVAQEEADSNEINARRSVSDCNKCTCSCIRMKRHPIKVYYSDIYSRKYVYDYILLYKEV